MKYTIIIQQDPKSGWYGGQCLQVPEAITQGETIDELLENMKEAIALAIECRRAELEETYRGREVFYRNVTVTA